MTGNKSLFKILIPLILAAVSPMWLHAQNESLRKSVTISGSVQFISPQENKIWLYKEETGNKAKAIDSATVTEQDKTFSFNLQQDHPGIYYVDAMRWDRVSFWSDDDVNINMRGYDTAKVHMKIPHYNFAEGSMDNNFINLYEQIGQLSYLRMVDELNEEYYAKQHKDTDSAWITYLNTRKKYDDRQEDYRLRKAVLMEIYKDRPVLLYALRENIGPNNEEKYKEVMAGLDRLIELYPWLTEAKTAKETIITNMEMASKVQAGKPVPFISYPDQNGKQQSLDKYKGNYLLIDFWASWCGPCRAAIPKVKELYVTHHPKGFNVLSISIDDSREAWRKAMKDEKMPWEQLLSPDKDQTMKQFQFGGIPTLYLIDPNGNIIKSFTGYSPEAEKEIKSILENKVMAPSNTKKSMPAMSF